jgi:hypothetical protein
MPHAVLSQTIFRPAEECRHVFQLLLVCEATGAHGCLLAPFFSLKQWVKRGENELIGWDWGVYISYRDHGGEPGCGAEKVVKVMPTTADFCTSMYA